MAAYYDNDVNDITSSHVIHLMYSNWFAAVWNSLYVADAKGRRTLCIVQLSNLICCTFLPTVHELQTEMSSSLSLSSSLHLRIK